MSGCYYSFYALCWNPELDPLDGCMRSFLFASAVSVVCGVDVPDFVVGTYSYVFNNDLYALQLSVYSNSTADFDFIINNDCEKDVVYPKHWAMHGLKVDYNETEHELGFLESLDGYESIIDDIRTTFEKVGPLVTPIRVKVADDGSSIQANIIKVHCSVPKTSDPIDMAALQKQFSGESDATVPPIIAGESSAKSSSSMPSWTSVMVVTPLAAGMLDWLTFH